MPLSQATSLSLAAFADLRLSQRFACAPCTGMKFTRWPRRSWTLWSCSTSSASVSSPCDFCLPICWGQTSSIRPMTPLKMRSLPSASSRFARILRSCKHAERSACCVSCVVGNGCSDHFYLQVYEKLVREGMLRDKLLEMYRWGKQNGWDASALKRQTSAR